MNRKLIEVWLFLSVLGLILSPESSTIGSGASSSNAKKDDSDPKLENTDKINPSRGFPNSLNFKDDSDKFPQGPVSTIAQNKMEFNEQTKHLSCKPGQKAMYVLHPQKKETYVGCYKDKLIHGYCPEFNAKGLQAKHAAPCYISICDASYYASEGYKFRKCFEIYGGISSPNCMCTTHSEETLTTVFIDSLSVVCIVLILPYLYIFCIGFCIRKHFYKNNIDYKKYFQEAHRALETCRMQITGGPNNEREEAD